MDFTKAAENLMKVFEQENFVNQVARTVIARHASDKQKPIDRWSLGNALTIMAQGTEDARTFKQWKAVGRNVKKGSYAMYIICPIVYKTDEKDENGEPIMKFAGYRYCPVFAVEDTEGKDLPVVDYKPVELPPLFNVAEKLGLKVDWKSFGGAEYGYYAPNRDQIVLKTHDITTYYHELAHAIDDRYVNKGLRDREKAEVVAQLTAAVLMEMQGIKGYEKYSADYIKGWSHSKSAKETVTAAMRVLSDVEKIINIIMENADEVAA